MATPFVLLVSIFCVPSHAVACGRSFGASVFGVKTHITLQRQDRATVSVTGFGFAESGVARLVDDELFFDDSFETFLRSKRIRILGIVERTTRYISVRVRVPLWGSFVVRLLEETDFR